MYLLYYYRHTIFLSHYPVYHSSNPNSQLLSSHDVLYQELGTASNSVDIVMRLGEVSSDM